MKSCQYCLNAYNSAYDVRCVNLEWDSQFDSNVNVVVSRSFICSRFSPRRNDQEKLKFNVPVQLDLFSYVE